MSVFKRVAMKDLEKYVATPDSLKRMQCQLNVNGPQFYEGKVGRRKVQVKGKGVKSNDKI